ncbi:hypothetical protein SAMD00019534_088220 [Acytostelium subglobosum LB1]|uniref:hypothetical protein n=1 Tax=Acytostelium subglobosum LB1 TaxID=1410327 RepID=UPI000644B9ED|nr:hypothetical protein SAMD00019534_088220 [Acytostelium subglobosum LB1]GAM25647.1 hypothetical protein SAMD00019534_088220 [Acytostelium subglobosum LB1]|eukprot:XP_012751633.1 hypothetical protein SAMD00019534_088220 [Acytostelium subglobosum LB1]
MNNNNNNNNNNITEIPKSHSSGKRKFLQDIPSSAGEHDLEKQIYKELDDLVLSGEKQAFHSVVSLSSPSLPQWGGDISTTMGFSNYSSSGSMGGVVTILTDENGDPASADQMPSSHMSTRYGARRPRSNTGSSIGGSAGLKNGLGHGPARSGGNSSSSTFLQLPSIGTIPGANGPQPQGRHLTPNSLLGVMQKSASNWIIDDVDGGISTHSSLGSAKSDNSMRIDNLVNSEPFFPLTPRGGGSDFTLSPHSSHSLLPGNGNSRGGSRNNSNTNSIVSTMQLLEAANGALDSLLPVSHYSGGLSTAKFLDDAHVSLGIGGSNSMGGGSKSRPTYIHNGWMWVKDKHSILVLGPNGIGKSFLLNTLLQFTFVTSGTNPQPIIGSHRRAAPAPPSLSDSAPMETLENTSPYLLSKLKNHHQPSQIDQTYTLDEKFNLSVDWVKERELELDTINKTTQYLLNMQPATQPSINNNHPFLLPQGRVGAAQMFRISYAATCEMLVDFISETELRGILWELHQFDSDRSTPIHARRLEYLQLMYTKCVALQPGTTTHKQLADVKTSWDLPIAANIRPLLGKTIQFKGIGNDHNIDRIFIREKLREVLADYSFVTSSFFLKLPCSILRGRREITILSDDTRRGNISKSRITQAINEADQIALSFDFRGLSADLADIIIGSNFMQKLGMDGVVQFAELGERQQNKYDYPKGIYNSKGMIISQLKKLYRNARSPHNLEHILNTFKLIQLMPLLFSSADLNKALPSEYDILFNSMHHLKAISNIPLFIKIINQASYDSWSRQLRALDEFKDSFARTTSIVHLKSTQPQAIPIIHLENSASNVHNNSNQMVDSPPEQPPQSPATVMMEENLSSSFTEQLHVTRPQHQQQQQQHPPGPGTGGIRGNNWRSQYLQYKQVGPSPGPSSVEGITSSLRTRVAQWKRKLLAYISSEASESVFLNRVAECESISMNEWERFRISSPDYVGTVTEICSNLYALTSSRLVNTNGNGSPIDFYSTTSSNPVVLLCKQLIMWTPNFWRENLIDRLPPLQDEIIVFSQSILGDVSKLLLNKVAMTAEEKAMHVKLVKYCQASSDRNIHTKIQHIQNYFVGQNMTQLIYTICLDALCSELMLKVNDPKLLFSYHDLIQKCFHSTPLMSAARIQQRLLEMLGTALSYIDSIEKHLEHTMQYLLNSPFRLRRQKQAKAKPEFVLNIIDNYINIVDPFESKDPRVAHASKHKLSAPPLVITHANSNSTTQLPIIMVADAHQQHQQQQDDDQMMEVITDDIDASAKKKNRTDSGNGHTSPEMQQHGSTSYLYSPKTKLAPQTPAPLLQLCIAKVCQQIHTLRGITLPDELLQKVITMLINQERVKGSSGPITTPLDDTMLSRLLVPTILALDLEGAHLLTANSTRTIGSVCTQLQKLSLANCTNISSESLTAIGNGCKNLEVINLKGCFQVCNAGVLALARGCHALRSINLSGCIKVTDAAIHELHQYSRRLQTLELRRCVQVTDAAFQAFNLTTLQSIDLLECSYITDHAIVNICNNSRQLTSIKISGKGITDVALKCIGARCKSLAVLETIMCEQITDEGVQAIVRNCLDISTLNLCSSKNITTAAFQIDDELILPADDNVDSMDTLIAAATSTANQQCLQRLVHLDLNRCINTNDSSVLAITIQATHLETISLAYCEDITDESIVAIAQRCPNLKNIDLTKCKNVTDASVMELARTKPQLNRLVLFACTLITDNAIIEVATMCPSLIHLDISMCEKITDASLIRIAHGLPMLRVICLEECVITDTGVSALGSISDGFGCAQLESIKLGYCRFISDSALLRIAVGCPMLSSVDLSYCSNLITPQGIRHAIKMWPKLHTLKLRGYNSLTSDTIIDGTPLRLKSANLSWCLHLEDSALINFAKSCPSLENLDISRCPKITDAALESVIDSCSSIRFVNVSGCKDISSFIVQKLTSHGVSIYR